MDKKSKTVVLSDTALKLLKISPSKPKSKSPPIPSFKVNVNDILVIQRERGVGCVKVLGVSGSSLVVRREESKVENKRVSEDVESKDVLVNLGPDPKPGSVYGAHVEVFRGSAELEDWGYLHYYKRLSKETKSGMRKAFARAHVKLATLKLLGFLPLVIEIREPKGKYAGYYKVKKDQEFDVVCLKPKMFNSGEIDVKELTGLILHEAGHAVMTRLMPHHVRSKWVGLYARYISAQNIAPKDLRQMLSDIEGGQSLASATNKDVLKLCLSQIHHEHKLRKSDLTTILDSGESIAPYWPTEPWKLREVAETPTTDYGMTNADEFWAEAFRIHLSGGKLPKRIARVMDTTLQACRGRVGGPAHDGISACKDHNCCH